jgi:hypothetical protein
MNIRWDKSQDEEARDEYCSIILKINIVFNKTFD